MYCPKCGATLTEETSVCPSCGNEVTRQEEMVFQTAYQPPATHLSAKARGLKKKEFLVKEADESVKNAAKFSFVSFLIAAILVFASIVVASNTAIYKLPVISLVMDKRETEDMKEDMKIDSDLFDDARDALDELEDDLKRDEYKAIAKFIDKGEEVSKNPSFSNLSGVVKQAEKLSDFKFDRDIEKKLDLDSLDDALETMEEAAEILNTIQIVAYVFAVIVVLIALLAFFKKSVGLVIFNAIFAAPFILAFSGFLWYVLILAAFIAMMFFFTKINKAYKA